MSEVHKAVFSIFALILSAVFVVACQAQSAMPTASSTAPLVEEDCETPPDVEVCAPGELDSAAAPFAPLEMAGSMPPAGDVPASASVGEMAALSLLEPPAGDTVGRTPSLRWAAWDGATGYRVRVTDAATESVVFEVTVSETQAIVADSLLPTRTYTWQVEALDDKGGLLATGSEQFVVAAD